MINNSNDKKKRGKHEYLTKDFVIKIKENALSSLKHGIEHFMDKDTDDNLKFAILHIFHSLELFLKARLADEHPLLIYNKPEEEIDMYTPTVDFKTLINRLENAGVTIVEKDDLEYLKNVRNCIEHHQIRGGKKEIRGDIVKASRFLEWFLKKHFDINLKEKIEEKSYKILAQAIYSYEERLKKAKEDLEKYLTEHKDYKKFICLSCLNETLPVPDYPSVNISFRCFFCDEEFSYQQCNRCGERVLSGHLDSKPWCDCGGELTSL